MAVNSIRNRFAHHLDVNSFDHPKLTPFIDKLSVAYRRHAKDDIFGGMSREPLPRKRQTGTR